jgi:glycosyltransferase involved in cell wall biosynthesis
MLIWLITVGEPLPTDDTNDRLHRVGLLANYLIERGHQVVWWTSTFNHSRKKHRFNSDTFIKLHNNYRINLLYSIGYKNNVSIHRIMNHYSIANKFLRLAKLEKNPDIILCSLPTLELSLAATQYGGKKGVPVVLDIRDLWPDCFLDLVPGWGKKFARLLLYPWFKKVRFACSNAMAIIGITPAFVDWGLRYANRTRTSMDMDFPFGYTATKPNEEAISIAKKRWEYYGIKDDSSKFICCFFGAISRQFDLETVIDAARRLKRKNDSFKFILCGSGDKLAYYKSLSIDCENVIFPGWVEAADIWTLMRMSKVGLAPYKNNENFTMNIPNKPIEYFSAGLPVLSSLKGFLNDLLMSHDCGITYRSGNADDLAESLIYLYAHHERLRDMSTNAYELYKNKFMADNVYSNMISYLESFYTNYLKL